MNARLGRDLVALRPLINLRGSPPDVRKCLRPFERRPPKLLGLRPASPFDAINIDHQGLILHGTSLPDSRAGSAVINVPLNQSRAHWIQMNVVDLLLNMGRSPKINSVAIGRSETFRTSGGEAARLSHSES